jgi:hypothetical protein
MPSIPLLIEVILKVQTILERFVILSPILVAILTDEPNIRLEFGCSGIFTPVHLALDGTKIHRALDDIEVVRDIVRDGINGVAERSNETSPVARAGEHAADHAAAVVEIFLGSQWDDVLGSSIWTGSTTVDFASGWLGFACLLDGWLDFIDVIGGVVETNFGFTTALHDGSDYLEVDFRRVVVDEIDLRLWCLRGEGGNGGEITHDNYKLTEYLLRKRFSKSVANLWGSAH